MFIEFNTNSGKVVVNMNKVTIVLSIKNDGTVLYYTPHQNDYITVTETYEEVREKIRVCGKLLS